MPVELTVLVYLLAMSGLFGLALEMPTQFVYICPLACRYFVDTNVLNSMMLLHDMLGRMTWTTALVTQAFRTLACRS